MAGKNRRSNPDIARLIEDNLLKNASKFSFFQILRLLYFAIQSSQETSADNDKDVCIRMTPSLELSFPPSDIKHVEKIVDNPFFKYSITANFLGLYGTSTPLPIFYTQELMDDDTEGLSVTRDFINIFNQRMYDLLYDTWKKYRIDIQVVEHNDTTYIERLSCLLGLGETRFRNSIHDIQELFRYIGLFSQFKNSQSGLVSILRDSFEGIPISILPCIKRKVSIQDDQKFYLGTNNAIIGQSSFIGVEFEDYIGKFRIQIGSVNAKQYRSFFPGKKRYKKLVHLVNHYLSEPLDYDLDVILEENAATKINLGSLHFSRIGLDAILFSGDTIGKFHNIIEIT